MFQTTEYGDVLLLVPIVVLAPAQVLPDWYWYLILETATAASVVAVAVRLVLPVLIVAPFKGVLIETVGGAGAQLSPNPVGTQPGLVTASIRSILTPVSIPVRVNVLAFVEVVWFMASCMTLEGEPL